MRNLNVYLVLFLCLFVNRILAQDQSQNREQLKETYENARKKYDIKFEEIWQEEERNYNNELVKLKEQRRKGNITKQEFKDQQIVLEKKKLFNVRERNTVIFNDLRKQFPEMGEKTFEGRAEQISNGIRNDIYEEKQLLKKAIEGIDKQLIEGSITKTQAEEQKMQLAEARARSIESKVEERQKAFSKLAQDEIEGKLPNPPNDGGMSLTLVGNNISQKTKRGDIDARLNISLPAMKAYKGQKDKDRQQNKRTSSQLVFATGLNNLVTDRSIDNSDFKYSQSRFYEWGLTLNSRIIPNHNLLHAKYGLSLMYNDLKPTDNQVFAVNGNQTNLEVSSINLNRSRFRNVNVVVPLHLEFDFTKPQLKEDKTYFKSHNSFRLGIGGYFGANVKSKQILKYDLGDLRTKERINGDYNTTNFIYGLSTYVGYKATSLYLKYDLNPLFKDNVVKQNNVSLGLRFDFN